MQLEYAMLALGADFSEKKLLHIFGGGFDSMEVERLPGIIPPFAVIVKLSEDNVAEEQTHTFSLVGINPDGERKDLANQPTNFSINPSPAGEPSRSTIIIQVYLHARIPGKHEIAVVIDGIELKRLPLTIKANEVIKPPEE